MERLLQTGGARTLFRPYKKAPSLVPISMGIQHFGAIFYTPVTAADPNKTTWGRFFRHICHFFFLTPPGKLLEEILICTEESTMVTTHL
jgi:hypothetical protein